MDYGGDGVAFPTAQSGSRPPVPFFPQLKSFRGLIKLAAQHRPYLRDYALVAQNLLDDVACFAEGLYALATCQDPACSLLFCGGLLCVGVFVFWMGFGAAVYLLLLVLLRPPWLKGGPGRFGVGFYFGNLPSRSVEELM